MKLVVNILDNELCSSKARINFNRNKIGHVLKLMFFLTLFNGHVVLSMISECYTSMIITTYFSTSY